MAVMKQWLVEALLNHAFRGEVYTPPDNVYLALYSSAPTATTNGTELSGGAYTRQLLSFDEPLDGVMESAIEVLFPAATTNWGSVAGWAVCNASSGGLQMVFKSIAPVTVNIGDVVRFVEGVIQISQAA